MFSKQAVNNLGEMESPWRTPLLILIDLVPVLKFTVEVEFL